MAGRYALCIGVNEYRDAHHLNLRYACSDAQEIADILADPVRGGFDDVHVLLDEHAQKAAIRQEIVNLLTRPGRQIDDLVLIYFSGHGIRDRQNDLCLVPHDFCHFADGSLDFASMVHAKEIEMIVGNSDVRNIILLIDCCHSGALGKVIGEVIHQENSNIFVIGAARASESAVETVTLRHGVFTECLLRALNLPPDHGEWITLGEVVKFIIDEIEKFPTSQLIETTSHYVSISIPIARNPNYSAVSSSFTEEVRRTFQLAGYDIEPPLARYAFPNLFIARVRAGFRHTQTGVLCLDNKEVQLTKAHIDQFLSLIQQLRSNGEVADGSIVTRRYIPADMRRQIAASGVASWATESELLRSLINFDHYLHRLIDEFDHGDPERPSEPALADYYVDLEAEIQTEKEDWRGLATDYLQKWSNSLGKPHIVLLGQYGSGKSTVCRKLARDLAESYLRASTKGGRRIPVLIPLREFPRGQADIEVFIAGHLARRCGVHNPNFEAFRIMNDAGLLLLIFDGFDEMAVHTDEDVIQANLTQIEQLAVSPKSKVLLTSRPEYFKTSYEELQILQPTGLLSRHTKYKRLLLLPFGEEQIRTFLQKRLPFVDSATHDWKFFYHEINRIHDLSDLSRRPVLLEMIVKTLPELVAKGEKVDRPTLYQTYLEGELRRQAIEKRRELLIKRDDRFLMMQTLALYFYMENLSGLTADLVQILLYDQLTSRQREELEAHTRDFLSCSFLMRQGDSYYFSHRSLVEYLTARALGGGIRSGDPTTFGRRLLTMEVVDFLSELLQEPDFLTLGTWVASTRYRKFEDEDVRYLGANAITVLNKLGHELKGVDYSGTVLRGANLEQAMCRGAIFSKADLGHANLTEALLDDCNFQETDFTRANLHSAQARRSDFRGAYLDHTDFSGADLVAADLSSCICYAADFTNVLGDDARLENFHVDDFHTLSPSLKVMLLGVDGTWSEGDSGQLTVEYVDGLLSSLGLMLRNADGEWSGSSGEQLKIECNQSSEDTSILGVLEDSASRIEFAGVVDGRICSLSAMRFDVSKPSSKGMPYSGWLTFRNLNELEIYLGPGRKSPAAGGKRRNFHRDGTVRQKRGIVGVLQDSVSRIEFEGVLDQGEYLLEGTRFDASRARNVGMRYSGWLTFGDLDELVVSLGPARRNRRVRRRIFRRLKAMVNT